MALSAGLGLLLPACGGGSEPQTSDASQSTASSTAAPTPEPSESEYFSRATPIDPGSGEATPDGPAPVRFTDPGALFRARYADGVSPDKKPPKHRPDLKKRPHKDGFHSHEEKPAKSRPRTVSHKGSIGLRAKNVNTHCNDPGATVDVKAGGATLKQSTPYCWAASGHGLFYIGPSDLKGAAGGNTTVSWKGVAEQWVRCSGLNNIKTGVCEQTTKGRFEQRAGSKTRSLPVWTVVRVYYNGYAECANSHVNRWRPCS